MNWNHWKKLPFCLLIAGLASGCFEAQWEKEVSENSSEAMVSASDLCKAFGMDKSSANQSYKGKVIEVFGNVQETWGEGERTMVVLSGGDLEVRCLVSSQSEPDLADLKVGRPTLVKGKCRGLVRGDIALGGCVIQDSLRGLKAKARSGDMTAQFDLAGSLSTASEGVRDVRRSFQMYCKAAEKGHEEAKATVMKAMAGAWSPETNSPVIWQWLREEAEGGNVEACYLLGLLYNIEEDFGIDPKASVPWFKKASDGGHQEAMFTMAMFNYNGELVPTNKTESARLLSLVDSKALPIASEVLGRMMIVGDGVIKDISKGFSLLESAAMNGRAQAAAMIGRIYLAGEILPMDKRKAQEWLIKAGELGDARSMAKAGLMVRQANDEGSMAHGQGMIFAALSNDTDAAYSEIVSHVAEEVVSRLEERNPGLKTNDSLRLRRLNGTLVQGTVQEVKSNGVAMATGSGVVTVGFIEMDVTSRTRCDPLFRELLARSVITEKVLGLMAGFEPSENMDSAQDAMETLKLLKSMAADGLAEAQTWLGLALMEDRKTEEGIGWLKKSAEGGSSEGQYALGQAYFKGLGLPVDCKEAFRLFRLAADQGHAEAMLEAGRMLMAGDGCERNIADGLGLVRRSADALESQAILFMGRYCYGDKRGMRDAAQAFAWFRLGAVLGMSESQYWLGRMYYEGKGVPVDYNRAIQWLTESAYQGYRPAANLLDSDAYQKEELAKAKAAYQQELERHTKALERIRTNPKYDVLITSRTPSFFGGAREKAAYMRYTDNYMKRRFGGNIAACVDEAYRYVGSGGARRGNLSRSGQYSGGGIKNLGKGADGLYDGMGPTGKLYTSPDGVTWTANLGYRPGGGWAPSYEIGAPSNPFRSSTVTYGFGEFGRMINPSGLNF